MRPARAYPFSVKPVKIAGVERVPDTPSFGNESQLVPIGLPGETERLAPS